MRFFVMILLTLFAAGGMHALSNEDMRAIMDKKIATVGDAIYVIYSIDNPDAVMADIDQISNRTIKGMNRDAVLDAGTLAVIAIELKKAGGGILYIITGWSRYAALSLVYEGIYPEAFAWDRGISGMELIELTGTIKSRE